MLLTSAPEHKAIIWFGSAWTKGRQTPCVFQSPPHLKPDKSYLWRSAHNSPSPTTQVIYHSFTWMMYSAAVKMSACSEMSRIVTAACCVYFLPPSFCSAMLPLGEWASHTAPVTCPIFKVQLWWHICSTRQWDFPTPRQAKRYLDRDHAVQAHQCLCTVLVYMNSRLHIFMFFHCSLCSVKWLL